MLEEFLPNRLDEEALVERAAEGEEEQFPSVGKPELVRSEAQGVVEGGQFDKTEHSWGATEGRARVVVRYEPFSDAVLVQTGAEAED